MNKIVDVGRNFSVMVKVEGPDPKGLKMRKHAFHHYNSGKTTLSASGMLLPNSLYDAGLVVLTVASVIEPFLSLSSPHHRDNTSQQAKYELIAGSQIHIMVEGKIVVEHDTKILDKATPHWLPAKLLTLVDIPESSIAVQSLIAASSGSLENGWEVGWSLASYTNGPQTLMDAVRSQVQQSSVRTPGQMMEGESRNPSLMGKSTTRIAILGVSSIVDDLPNLKISRSNKKGDLLLAVGSPFGVLSPVHFFNSISVGSVANCYPTGSSSTSLLMADIRCLPGVEGSPVFGENAQLIGILTRPLRQKTSGAEIQLVIPWEAIETALSDLLHEEAQNASKGTCFNSERLNSERKTFLFNSLDKSTPVEKSMASICLVTIDGGVWASGVLLNKQGLILTNAHLLEPWRFGKTVSNGELGGYKCNLANVNHRIIRVRVDHTYPWIWCDARVVYISKGPLDIALLQLEFVPDHLCPIIMDLSCPSVGSKAYVVGHGLFGPRCDFSPSACLGVVAKVVEAKGPHFHKYSEQESSGPHQFPAMIETTAPVHPGGSGGAVVNSDGHMIGLVTSNARHGGGTVIPNLNFSIPCVALEPIFKFSKDVQNLSLLDDLDKPNEQLSSIWALIPPSLSPKPIPSLPNLPHILPRDNNKDAKGSRFAKFISERQELLKKNSQIDKMGSLPAKFIPNKL